MLASPLSAAKLSAFFSISPAQMAVKGARPGKPTAKAPKGRSLPPSRPSSGATARARKYELRVYKGKKLLLKKTGLAKRSWKSSKALPECQPQLEGPRQKRRRRRRLEQVAKFRVVPLSSAKAFTAFSLRGLTPAVIGVIDQSAHTIALNVPYGTDVTTLVATFTTTGSSVTVGSTTQVSGTRPTTSLTPSPTRSRPPTVRPRTGSSA